MCVILYELSQTSLNRFILLFNRTTKQNIAYFLLFKHQLIIYLNSCLTFGKLNGMSYKLLFTKELSEKFIFDPYMLLVILGVNITPAEL